MATAYVLTNRGRVRAVLTDLDNQWDRLTISDKARVLHLVEQLAEAVRREQRPADRRPVA